MGAKLATPATVFHVTIDRDEVSPWGCGHVDDYSDCADCALGWMSFGLGIFAFFHWVLNALKDTSAMGANLPLSAEEREVFQRIADWEEMEEDFECVKCHASMIIDEEFDPTAVCNPCAQDLIPRLLEQLEQYDRLVAAIYMRPDDRALRVMEDLDKDENR